MDWGSTVPHKQWGILPMGFWAMGSFTDVRKGDAETGRGWLGRGDFP